MALEAKKKEFAIPGFPGRDFAKSRDPGIFRDGISLIITYILEELFVCKIHYTDKGLIYPILWQAARASRCSELLVTQKRACLVPEKVEAKSKSNLGLLRDMGFRNK